MQPIQKFLAVKKATNLNRAIKKSGFIFVDIPRTASTMLRVQLGKKYSHLKKPYYEDAKVRSATTSKAIEKSDTVAHLTAQDWQARLGAEVWSALYRFSVVRNPYNRLYSIYKYRIEREGSDKIPFGDFVENLLYPRFHDTCSIFHWPHWRSTQWSFLADTNDKLIVNDVFKFECLTEACETISEELNIEVDSNSRIQATSGIPKMDEVYNEKNISIVKSYYRDDFENFGYSTDIRDAS